MTGLFEALRPVLVLLLGVLLELVQRRARPTAEDGRRAPELRERLRRKVRNAWKLGVLIPIVVLLLAGCGTRTIYVPHGEPVRLRETIRDAKVWVLDADGKPVAGKVDIPEGWYALPLGSDQ